MLYAKRVRQLDAQIQIQFPLCSEYAAEIFGSAMGGRNLGPASNNHNGALIYSAGVLETTTNSA